MARKPVAEPEVIAKKLPAVRKATNVGAVGDWRTELAKYAQKTIKMEESVATGNRISTKGGVLSYHGTRMQNNEMSVIVLAALIENAYYDGPYDPDNPSAPVCFAFSEDGEDMAPHEKAHAQQHETCKGCPHDEWGSAERGRGKACKNLRRLAVLSFPEGASLKEVEDGEIAMLSVSVTSVKSWSGYAKDRALTGLPVWAYGTRIGLERPEGKEYSNLFFQSVGKPLSEKLYPAILERVKQAERILEEPYIYTEREAPPKAKGRVAKNRAVAPSNSSKRSKY